MRRKNLFLRIPCCVKETSPMGEKKWIDFSANEFYKDDALWNRNLKICHEIGAPL